MVVQVLHDRIGMERLGHGRRVKEVEEVEEVEAVNAVSVGQADGAGMWPCNACCAVTDAVEAERVTSA